MFSRGVYIIASLFIWSCGFLSCCLIHIHSIWHNFILYRSTTFTVCIRVYVGQTRFPFFVYIRHRFSILSFFSLFFSTRYSLNICFSFPLMLHKYFPPRIAPTAPVHTCTTFYFPTGFPYVFYVFFPFNFFTLSISLLKYAFYFT